MTLETIPYQQYLSEIPQTGRHILAQQTADEILVYQAYRSQISNFAVGNQYFGGNAYSYSRMSWIKPNFLWMMYRCGWAEKAGQENVLAIWIPKSFFDQILAEAVYSAFKPALYGTQENWKAALAQKEVRLQWDPDHDIYGEKQERKAIQLGLKGNILAAFGKEKISKIEHISNFVHEQKAIIDAGKLEKLQVPKEEIYLPQDEALCRHLGIA